MRNWRLYALLVVVLVLFVECSCFAQKVTVDPNVGQPSKPAEDPAADARLAGKVTYEAWHTPLKTILADLTKSTGVTLNAGYSKQDWQVRDRRMNIYVKDVTLAELMNSIARVMKFKWSKNDELKPPTYRLIADRRLLAKLQAESSKRQNELRAEEIRRRTKLMEGFEKAAKASDEELEKLRQESPYLYTNAKTGFAKMVTQMFADFPKLRDAFLSADRSVIIPAKNIPPSTQQLCVNAIRSAYPMDHLLNNYRQPPLDDLAEDFAKRSIQFDMLPKPMESDMRQRLFYFGFVMAATSNGIRFVGDLRDLGSKSTRLAAQTSLGLLDQTAGSQEDFNKLLGDEHNAMQQDTKEIEYYLMLDPVVEHADEPDLRKKLVVELTKDDEKTLMDQIKANGGQATSRFVYQAALKAIVKAAKTNVISDSYSVVLSDNPSFPDGELKTVLDNFTDLYRCNWEKHGSIIEICRRDWFRRRSSQIPDEWLKPWRDQVEKDSIATLDSYTHILALDQEQIEENISSDCLLAQVIGPWWDFRVNTAFSRFYVQLSDYQKNQLAAEQGLDSKMLSPRQWPYFSGMYNDAWHSTWGVEGLGDAESVEAKMTVSTKSNEDGSAAYAFTVDQVSEDGSHDKDAWTIPLHKVIRPQDMTQAK